jgi:hypothetical protein
MKCFFVLTIMPIFILFMGCAYQVPISESGDLVELTISPSEMILEGGAMASTRRFHILFFGFGKPNSFLEAERLAIERSDSDLLVGRIRLKQFEGLLLPGMWLEALGVPNATDIPIVGFEVYTVAGTGIRIAPE